MRILCCAFLEKKTNLGLNFFQIKRSRQNTLGTLLIQNLALSHNKPELEGIANIKPPTRLFLMPYSSFYVNANARQKTVGTLKGGLDIKYELMTLLPLMPS
jgi:hypothetical protein